MTPPGEELPALPSTAIGRTATALPLDQSDVRVSPRTSDHHGSAVWQCFGSVGSACPLTSIFPGRVLESIDRRWRPYIGLGNRNIGNEYTHCGKVFELIDGRFAIYRPSPKSLAGRRHENEEDATVFGNLHGGMAERRAAAAVLPLVQRLCFAHGTTLLWRRRQIRRDGVCDAHGV